MQENDNYSLEELEERLLEEMETREEFGFCFVNWG